jgi:hypothetical protein
MKQRIALLAAFTLLVSASLTAQMPAKADPWTGLHFLVGSWEAKTTGGAAQAESSGDYSFHFELRGHVLARHSAGKNCKGPDDFDCQHNDLLYIYPEGPVQALQAIYFDNEGHVIHYSVSIPRPGRVVFLSDPALPGPQFRLTYELAGGVMTGRFQLQLPGQTEFATYLEWSGKQLH